MPSWTVSSPLQLAGEEFAHILTTFPVVPQETKDAALAAYRDLAPKTADAELAALLLAGEGPRLNFKSTLRWDLKENRKTPTCKKVVVKTVAGFLNAEGGGGPRHRQARAGAGGASARLPEPGQVQPRRLHPG